MTYDTTYDMSSMHNIPLPQYRPGTSGQWTVEQFTISEESARFENIRAAFKRGARYVRAGTFWRLTRDRQVIMSTTDAEIYDLYPLYQAATGAVLINGLGLGVAAAFVLSKPDVTSVTVIEASQDVISLISPVLDDPRLSILHADAFTWKPPAGLRWNAVWHDIWDNICSDNLSEMTKLHRKYGRRCDWQESWCRDLCKGK